MKPIKFPEANVTYGENQEEYEPLPALKFPHGEVVTCFQLTDEELDKIKETKCIWLALQTFNQPLQPLFLSVDKEDVIYNDGGIESCE